MKQSKVLSLIGIAARGRNVVSGEFSTEKSVKDGSAYLVIVAEDASDNTKKKFLDKSRFYEVPCFVFESKENLGHAMGRQMRSSLAVTDSGLANAIMKHLEESNH